MSEQIYALNQILNNDDALLMHNLTEMHKLQVSIDVTWGKHEEYVYISTNDLDDPLYGGSFPVIDIFYKQEKSRPYMMKFYLNSEDWFPQISKKFRSKYKPRRQSNYRDHEAVEELVEIELWFKSEEEVIKFFREALTEDY